jgi:hypothetical protein|uniref:hypothetical protein n=1 Tax=uncultured Acidovorax sp. TaxID=158751 RepID=UPI00076A6D43|nr:hypothetical protein [uncultured Acidovorax sp.]
MTAIFMHGGRASLKEYTMQYQDQSTLALQTACLIQQNQMLKQQNTMLLELLDGMESVGDRLWRVERRLATQSVDQAGARKQATKKRRPAHEQSVARTRSDK